MSTRVAATVQVQRWWPVILAGALLLIQFVYPSRVWVVLLWMVGGAAALGWVWMRELARRVTVERSLRYGWAQVGDRLEERFVLSNKGWLPLLWAEIVDASDLPGYSAARAVSCDGHSVVRWTTDAECERRGVFHLGPWSLRASDPFGFFVLTLSFDDVHPIAVYPPLVRLPQIDLPTGYAAGRVRARRRLPATSGDVSQTRLYHPQDPRHLIHWPSTARHGELMVRDLQSEVAGDLWIVLDLDGRVQAGGRSRVNGRVWGNPRRLSGRARPAHGAGGGPGSEWGKAALGAARSRPGAGVAGAARAGLGR